MKTCTKCGEEKSLNDFSAAKREKDGKQHSCKDCNREYRQRNRDKIVAYHRNLRASNPEESRRRVREYAKRNPLLAKVTAANLKGSGQKITLHQVRGLFDSHGWCCYYCDTQSTDPSVMTLDHVVPFALGGENTIQNCVPACAACNSSKADKTESEFNNE